MSGVGVVETFALFGSDTIFQTVDAKEVVGVFLDNALSGGHLSEVIG